MVRVGCARVHYSKWSCTVSVDAADLPKITKDREAALPQVCVWPFSGAFLPQSHPFWNAFTGFVEFFIEIFALKHLLLIHRSVGSRVRIVLIFKFLSNVLLTLCKSTFNKQSCVTTKWPLLLLTMAPVILQTPVFLPITCFIIAFISYYFIVFIFLSFSFVYYLTKEF